MTKEIYIGIDSCRKGWFYTIITDASGCKTGVAPDIEWIWNNFAKANLILIDIPIGLPSISHRTCDTRARRFLGPGKTSSVFPPPCREALYAKNYEEACEINQKILGKKTSRQAWSIAPKIREVDEFLKSHPEAKKKIRETHPEVCFRALAGEPIIHSKKSNEGFSERLAVLGSYLPEAEKTINNALSRSKRKDVKPDDILDSMVAAITARFGNNRLGTLPDNPETDSTGLSMEIVYPKVKPQQTFNKTASISSIHNLIFSLINKCDSDDRTFPATEFYNETWTLRLILEWFSRSEIKNHPISFFKGCRWFSEGLIPSQFLARYRGDPLAETWTHADGIIGHFEVGEGGRADIRIAKQAQRLVCVEAKLFSRLSAGVKNASYFNQAARYAACMAELLYRANLKPNTMKTLGLYVTAPKEQIEFGIFDENLTRGHIQKTVKRRIAEYKGKKNAWFHDWFLPTLARMDLQCLSWESIIETMTALDAKSGAAMLQFYEKCLKYNLPVKTNTSQLNRSKNV